MMQPLLPDSFYISSLKKTEIRDLLYFLVAQNYSRSGQSNHINTNFDVEINNLYKEDQALFDHSVYYILKSRRDNKIHGSIKIAYWDRTSSLPIEKLFDLNAQKVIPAGTSHIWHIARFAISNDIPCCRITILKKLLFNAFYPVYSKGNGLILAECDKKLTTVLNQIGIKTYVLKESIQYLGSETVPIYIKSEWLQNFILSNRQRYFSTSDNNLKIFERFGRMYTFQKKQGSGKPFFINDLAFVQNE